MLQAAPECSGPSQTLLRPLSGLSAAVLPSLTLRLLEGDERLSGLVTRVHHLQHLPSSVPSPQEIDEQLVHRALVREEVGDPQDLQRASLLLHPAD